MENQTETGLDELHELHKLYSLVEVASEIIDKSTQEFDILFEEQKSINGIGIYHQLKRTSSLLVIINELVENLLDIVENRPLDICLPEQK